MEVDARVSVKAAPPKLTKGGEGGTAPLAVEITSSEAGHVIQFTPPRCEL